MHRRWLCQAVFFLTATAWAEEARVLTQVADVRALTLEEAERGWPVRLNGVVTYAEPAQNLLYVQDETGGMFIPSQWEMTDGSDPAAAQHQGAWVEIAGVSSKGKFMPFPAPEADGILRLVALGNANKQIAAQLGLAEVTVKVYVSRILEKLGAPDRTRASTLAIERGLVKL